MQTDQPEGRYSYFDMRWPEPGPAPGWPSGWGMKISFWCWTVCICWSGGLKRCWQRSFSSSPSESMALQSCQYWWKGCRWEGRKRSLQGKAAQSCPDWVFRWHLHSLRDVGQELRDLCCNLGFRLWKKGLERPCEWKTEPSDCVHWDKDGTQEQTLRAPLGYRLPCECDLSAAKNRAFAEPEIPKGGLRRGSGGSLCQRWLKGQLEWERKRGRLFYQRLLKLQHNWYYKNDY